MKGCLVAAGVVLLLILLAVGGGGFWVYNKAQQLAERLEVATTELHATNREFPFDEPDDGSLDAERFEQFLSIRSASVGPIEKLIESLDSLGRNDADEDFSFEQIMGAATGMITLLPEVMDGLVVALRSDQMSFDEYLWTTTLMHGTLAGAAAAGNAEADELLGDIVEHSNRVKIDEGDGNRRYDDIRRELRERFETPNPATLALVLAASDRVEGSPAEITLDKVLLNRYAKQRSRTTMRPTAPDAEQFEDATDSSAVPVEQG